MFTDEGYLVCDVKGLALLCRKLGDEPGPYHGKEEQAQDAMGRGERTSSQKVREESLRIWRRGWVRMTQVEEMRNGRPGRRSLLGQGATPLLSNSNGTGRGMIPLFLMDSGGQEL